MKNEQVYQPAKLNSFVYLFSFIVTGIVLLFLLYAVFAGKSKVDPTAMPGIYAGIAVLLLLMLFFGYLFNKHRKKPTYKLSHHDVAIGSGKTLSLSAIDDLYLFLSGKYLGTNWYNNLAFRSKDDNNQWHIIPADYSGKLELFIEHYIENRVPHLLNEMQRGNPAQFSMNKKDSNNMWARGPKSFINNLDLAPISLTADQLILDKQAYDYKNLQPLYWNGKEFEIKNKNGDTILQFKPNNFLSLDVFRILFNQKVQEKAL